MRYVALLRGINVGGHRVKMARLRALFEGMGYTEVATLLASGNVFFEAEGGDEAALEAAIESGLAEALGYDVATFVRNAEEMQSVVAGLDAAAQVSPPPESSYVLFLRTAPAGELADALEALQSDYDRFVIDGRHVYWVLAGKLSASPLFGSTFDRVTRGLPHTMRNRATAQKVAERLAAP